MEPSQVGHRPGDGDSSEDPVRYRVVLGRGSIRAAQLGSRVEAYAFIRELAEAYGVHALGDVALELLTGTDSPVVLARGLDLLEDAGVAYMRGKRDTC